MPQSNLFIPFNIGHVISIGSICHIAHLLKLLKWKTASYPFDWIRSNPRMVRHCVEDQFKLFLDTTQYTNHDPENIKAGVGHSVYGERIFVHHNPRVFQSHHDYFARCVDRFKIKMNYHAHHDNRLLFIIGFFNNSDPVRDDIIELNQTLRASGIRNYILLVINQTIQPGQHSSHCFTRHENLHMLELRTSSESNGVEFVNNEDNLYLDAVMRKIYKFNPVK